MKTKYCVLLILLSFASGYTHAQGKIDSLENLLKEELPDTSRIRILIALSSLSHYSDFTRSQEYTDEALALAEKLDDPVMKVAAYQRKSFLLTSNGNYTGSLKYDNLCLENDLLLKDSLHIARDYNDIGDDYYNLGEYDDAFFNFTQSYRIASAVHDTIRMLIAYHNVGRVFKELGQYDQALDHLNLAKKMSIQQKDEEGIPYAYDEIGDVQLRKHEYDSALKTLALALKFARKLDVRILQPKIHSKLATVYLRKGDVERARAYYDSAYALSNLTNDRFAVAEVELGRGILYTNEGQYDEALNKIEGSLTVAKELNARVLEIKCFNQLSLLWEMKGDFKKALLYYKEYKQLEDSLFSQEMQGKLLRDQLRFETESRDSRIAFLSELQNMQRGELKKQEFVRNILVVVMALSVILLLTVYRSGRRRRQINMLLLQHQEEMEKRSEELERLNQVKDKFFSIISHDLRSPINALSGLLDLLDKGAVSEEELPKHVKELKARFNHTRTLLNNLLDWTLLQMDKLNLQASKIDIRSIVEENIQLLSSVQVKDVKLTNEVPQNAIGFADSNTINLVIRNLMTNAIKFTNDGGQVIVNAKDNGDEWLISVTDNGVGINPEVLAMLFDKTAPYTTRGTANEKGTGLGLILCKEFIEKNGGKIWVESEVDKGSSFHFTLPKAKP
ncbi:MAG: tetratricopeptide repeat protein [Cyclobacteriaceae bacterium]|nr:tetratricopeptide repeat protein [Cyclobacteriaceae bacterium]MDH4296641.1 tetratricopeptide repeat protein [Cyclobacteriaceae bacterium]MDH5249554.1 tetratricopeptide repeat protein [Cyclobacteriaceae bacterium]